MGSPAVLFNSLKGAVMLDQDITTEIRLLKGNDVACMLNISRAFAYQLMRQGKIPTVRIGNAVRVRREDLLAYIDRNRQSFVFSKPAWPE
jgi:excisionase family DNA binding protein